MTDSPSLQTALPKRLTNEMKKRRNHRSTERNPKLHVLGYENNIIECEMENRPKTIKFKFDPSNVNPVEVAQDLVKQDLLSDSQTTIFIEMVRDIQRQLKENPHQLPIASQSYRRSMEKQQVISSLISSQTKESGTASENNNIEDENSAFLPSHQDLELVKSVTDEKKDNPQATNIINVCTVTDESANDNNSSCDENSRKASTIFRKYLLFRNSNYK
uniref:Serine/threonine-protein kinase WNK CCTL2 domain-containing protein n=1 Tax=Anopheles epiroticus TaxID=199890 RepID=A0A182P5U3_9DIPT